MGVGISPSHGWVSPIWSWVELSVCVCVCVRQCGWAVGGLKNKLSYLLVVSPHSGTVLISRLFHRAGIPSASVHGKLRAIGYLRICICLSAQQECVPVLNVKQLHGVMAVTHTHTHTHTLTQAHNSSYLLNPTYCTLNFCWVHGSRLP